MATTNTKATKATQTTGARNAPAPWEVVRTTKLAMSARTTRGAFAELVMSALDMLPSPSGDRNKKPYEAAHLAQLRAVFNLLDDPSPSTRTISGRIRKSLWELFGGHEFLHQVGGAMMGTIKTQSDETDFREWVDSGDIESVPSAMHRAAEALVLAKFKLPTVQPLLEQAVAAYQSKARRELNMELANAAKLLAANGYTVTRNLPDKSVSSDWA